MIETTYAKVLAGKRREFIDRGAPSLGRRQQSTPRPWAGSTVIMTLRTDSAVLLKCDFGKAPKLTGMQPLPLLRFQFIERVEADLEMLADPSTVEFGSHSGELDLSM